jgi:hypothetical protein
MSSFLISAFHIKGVEKKLAFNVKGPTIFEPFSRKARHQWRLWIAGLGPLTLEPHTPNPNPKTQKKYTIFEIILPSLDSHPAFNRSPRTFGSS